MATDGSIANKATIKVGQTFQVNTEILADIYMRLDAGNVTETDTAITFTVGGAFAYYGYENYVPYRCGYVAFAESGTRYTWDDYEAPITATIQSNMGEGQEIYHQFTMTKPSFPVGICPYIQVGCINRWGTDGTAGNYWCFGTTYGVMAMNSDASGGNTYTSETWDFTGPNGTTKTLQCFTLAGSTSGSNALSYANTTLKPFSPHLYVYGSDGKPVATSDLYVYDSSGNKQKAKSITVYNSSGQAKTIALTS